MWNIKIKKNTFCTFYKTHLRIHRRKIYLNFIMFSLFAYKKLLIFLCHRCRRRSRCVSQRVGGGGEVSLYHMALL